MEKKKETKLIGVIASVFLLFIVGVASFAYFGSFNVDLNNNVAVNINAVSPGNASFVSSATQLNLQVPAANMSQTNAGGEAAINYAVLTVNLTGAKDLLTTCTYDIVYEYDANSNIYGYGDTQVTANEDDKADITLVIYNGTNEYDIEQTKNGVNYYFTDRSFNYFDGSNPYGVFDENDKWDSVRKRVLVRNASISSTGKITTQNWLIAAIYYNLAVSQEQLVGKAFTGKIYVENYDCKTAESASVTILKNNGGKDAIEAKGIPNFSKTATENEGMYAAQDDLGTSYYFRGAVNNNWVKFGKDKNQNDMYWRIIRINGDNTIRMIYSGAIDPSTDDSVVSSNGVYMSTDDSMLEKTTFGGSGYQGGDKNQHAYGKCKDSTSCSINGKLIYNSNIKQQIDYWYKYTSLINTDSSKVVDAIYCNDRSASKTKVEYSLENYGVLEDYGLGGITYWYGAAGRLQYGKIPMLTCPHNSDRFTVDKITNTELGNGALTYPVGLITADEVAMAGELYDYTQDISNKSYYLYTENKFWTLSQAYHDQNAQSLFVNGGVSLWYNNTAVKPVISLSSLVILSGDGTYTNPYTVS